MRRLEATRETFLRWAVALAIVTAVHGAAVSWALWKPLEEDGESQLGGAFIVELAPITASIEDDSHVALGKSSNEQQEIQAVKPSVSSKAEPKPDEQPALPVNEAAEPENTVARPIEEKPPEKETPPDAVEASAVDTPPAEAQEKREAKAPRKIENATETSDQPVGRNVGLSQIDRQAVENWQRDLMVHINRHKRYPARAREAHQHGVVSVAFAMDREGRIVRAAIHKSAGYETLDQAAVELINLASPLPAPPAGMPGETIAFVVPVNYRWKD